MRGKKAKRLRRLVYGDLSLRARKWHWLDNGQIVRDELRRRYQRLKKEDG